MPRKPIRPRRDGEVLAMAFNQKEQRLLDRAVVTIRREASYSLKLLHLNNRSVKSYFRQLNDKVSRLRSFLPPETIQELRQLDAEGKLQPIYPSPGGLSSAFQIAATARRLHSDPCPALTPAPVPPSTQHPPSPAQRTPPTPTLLARRNSVSGVFMDRPTPVASGRPASARTSLERGGGLGWEENVERGGGVGGDRGERSGRGGRRVGTVVAPTAAVSGLQATGVSPDTPDLSATPGVSSSGPARGSGTPPAGDSSSQPAIGPDTPQGEGGGDGKGPVEANTPAEEVNASLSETGAFSTEANNTYLAEANASPAEADNSSGEDNISSVEIHTPGANASSAEASSSAETNISAEAKSPAEANSTAEFNSSAENNASTEEPNSSGEADSSGGASSSTEANVSTTEINSSAEASSSADANISAEEANISSDANSSVANTSADANKAEASTSAEAKPSPEVNSSQTNASPGANTSKVNTSSETSSSEANTSVETNTKGAEAIVEEMQSSSQIAKVDTKSGEAKASPQATHSVTPSGTHSARTQQTASPGSKSGATPGNREGTPPATSGKMVRYPDTSENVQTSLLQFPTLQDVDSSPGGVSLPPLNSQSPTSTVAAVQGVPPLKAQSDAVSLRHDSRMSAPGHKVTDSRGPPSPARTAFSSHTATERALGGDRRGSMSVTPRPNYSNVDRSSSFLGLLQDDGMKELNDQLYAERRSELLELEQLRSAAISRRKERFLKDMDQYLKDHPSPVTLLRHRRVTMTHSSSRLRGDQLPVNENDSEDVSLRRRRVEFHLNPTSLPEQDYRQRLMDLWRDMNKCRYLRLPDDSLDLSGVNTLATDTLRLYQVVRNGQPRPLHSASGK